MVLHRGPGDDWHIPGFHPKEMNGSAGHPLDIEERDEPVEPETPITPELSDHLKARLNFIAWRTKDQAP